MTARSKVRDEAVRLLLAAGWEQERIRQALGISQVLVARLVRKAQPDLPPRPRAQEGCCRIIADPRLGTARYCDDPLAMRGAVFCARHTHGGVWAS